MADYGCRIKVDSGTFEIMEQTDTASTASTLFALSSVLPGNRVNSVETAHFTEPRSGSGGTAAPEGGEAMSVVLSLEKVLPERTVSSLLNDYEQGLSGQTLISARSLFRKWVRPAIGHLPVGEVTTHHLEQLHASIPPRGSANAVVNYLHAAFRKAERWGEIPAGANPARYRGEYKHRLRPRTYILTAGERRLMWEWLEAEEASGARHRVLRSQAIQLLALTGLRKGEIIGLPWAEVALEAQIPTAYIEHTKTGEPKHCYLSPQAVDLLLRVGTKGNVFPWRTPHPLNVTWGELREACGFPHAVLHDLRRTYWSLVGESGVPVEDACATSGHADMKVHVRHYRQVSDKRKAEIAAIGAAAMVN